MNDVSSIATAIIVSSLFAASFFSVSARNKSIVWMMNVSAGALAFLGCLWLGSFGGLNKFAAMQLMSFSALCLVMQLVSRRGYDRGPDGAFILFNEAITIGFLTTSNVGLLFIFWVLAIAPVFTKFENGRLRIIGQRYRLFKLYQLFGSLCFLAGASIAVISHFTSSQSMGLWKIGSGQVGMSPMMATFSGILFIIAGATRQGIFPFHAGIMELFQRNRLTIAGPLVLSQMGLHLMVNIGMPLVKLSGSLLPRLIAMSLAVPLLYFAILATVQKRGRSLLALLTLFMSTIIVICFAVNEDLSLAGGVTQSMTLTLAVGGLAILVSLIEDRTGIDAFSQRPGLALSMPIMAVSYLLLALAAMNLPFTIGFRSEDLWIHSLFGHYPIAGLVSLAGCALMGLALYQSYICYFLGPAKFRLDHRDLKAHERIGVAMLLVAIMALGILPLQLN